MTRGEDQPEPELATLCSRATEITTRMRRDADVLVDVHHGFSAVLNRVVPLCAAAARRSWSSSSASAAASPAPPPPPLHVLRVAEVSWRVGLSRSSLLRMVKDGHFPKPRHPSAHAVGWLEPEVEDWLTRRRPFDTPARAETTPAEPLGPSAAGQRGPHAAQSIAIICDETPS